MPQRFEVEDAEETYEEVNFEGSAGAPAGIAEEIDEEPDDGELEELELDWEPHDSEQIFEDSDLPDRDELAPFEDFAPEVSQTDLVTRIDEYLDLANAEYDLAGGTKAKARPQFRDAKSGGIDSAKRRLRRVLGDAFERRHPRAIHNAVYGRPTPRQVAAITQALIDAGELAAVRTVNPGLSDSELIRRLQREFRVGIDCAGYVQLAFIHAFTGSDADTPSVRKRLGLKERRGYEKLADLPRSHFTKLKVTDAQAGDLLVLKPRVGDRERAWHTIIIVAHTVSGSEHTFAGDASWGYLYGLPAAGVARRTLMHDADTGDWWDIHPIDGSEVHRNRIGPYHEHPIHGLYRARHRAAKPTRELENARTDEPEEEPLVLEIEEAVEQRDAGDDLEADAEDAGDDEEEIDWEDEDDEADEGVEDGA